MAKRIIWSVKGKDDKKEILAYWLKRNQSFVYPRKLNKLLDDPIIQLAVYPYPRRNTDVADVFVKIVRDYKIFLKKILIQFSSLQYGIQDRISNL